MSSRVRNSRNSLGGNQGRVGGGKGRARLIRNAPRHGGHLSFRSLGRCRDSPAAGKSEQSFERAGSIMSGDPRCASQCCWRLPLHLPPLPRRQPSQPRSTRFRVGLALMERSFRLVMSPEIFTNMHRALRDAHTRRHSIAGRFMDGAGECRSQTLSTLSIGNCHDSEDVRRLPAWGARTA